jgi:hypothetical protein
MILLVSGFVFTAVGCATGSEQLRLPRIEALVDQAVDLEDLMDLHARATAVAVVQPTGRVRIEEFTPAKGVQATPFPIVELEVIDVIKGSLPDVIELREGYTYFDETGRETPVVSGPARFLLYLEPYSLGDGSAWNGQWVTTAWLSGVYMDLGRDSGVFTRVDPERTELPRELTVTLARDPGSARPEVPSP